MKKSSIIGLVVGASLLSVVCSVVLSVGFMTLPPKQLAKTVKADPKVFMDAFQEALQSYKAESEKRAAEEEKKRVDREFKNPIKIETKGRVTFGNPNSPVTIVEFSDFQCPYCARGSKRIKAIIKKYEGKVNLVYKHLPLSFHPLARPAAVYFEALALQNHGLARKFHDEIFDNFESYASLSGSSIETKLKALVKKVGGDLSLANTNKKAAEKVVDNDTSEAEKLGVRGTPTFFINGVRASGDMIGIIDRHLKKKN